MTNADKDDLPEVLFAGDSITRGYLRDTFSGLNFYKRHLSGSMDRMTNWLEWYNGLVKPSWTPAPATIGTIWQILYPIIIVTFGFVFVQAIRNKLSWKVALPFAINLVANLIFTPIQFGMRNLPLAAVDIVIVWTTIIWLAMVVWKHYKWVSLAQIPYFVWVSLATVLQLCITWNNR